MTDVAKPCIRGCTAPCRCQQCKEAGQPQHPPVPRSSAEGLLCRRCASNLSDWLTDIPDMYATLDTRMRRTERTEGGKRGKISGSPALIRLDVMAMLDPRTMPGDGMPGPDGRREYDDGLRDIAGTVCVWAARFTEEQHHKTDVTTLAAACSHLIAWFGTVTEQPWIDEAYDEIRQCKHLLDAAHGTPKPRMVGHCITVTGETSQDMKICGKPLFAAEGTAMIRCSECGRTYNGIEIVRLRVVEQHENGDTVTLPRQTA